MFRPALSAFAVAGALLFASAQVQMPDPQQISGVPLPAPDVPAGSISVRVIRGDFTNNVSGQAVDFVTDGKTRTVKTDDGGRAVAGGFAPGAHVSVATVLDGKRLESQDITIGTSGFRVVLAGVDPDAARKEAEREKLAEGPASQGLIVLGPESRIVAELSNERLNIYYVLEIVNSARTPVDIGGPLIVDLPKEAAGAALMDQPPPQASVASGRLTVKGPFPPGNTLVDLGFELPFHGSSVTLQQRYPAALEQLTVLFPQSGGIDVRSSQLTTKQPMTDQGTPIVVAGGPGIPAGGLLSIDITGLPHRPTWPQNLALTLAGLIMSTGILAAVFTGSRRREG